MWLFPLVTLNDVICSVPVLWGCKQKTCWKTCCQFCMNMYTRMCGRMVYHTKVINDWVNVLCLHIAKGVGSRPLKYHQLNSKIPSQLICSIPLSFTVNPSCEHVSFQLMASVDRNHSTLQLFIHVGHLPKLWRATKTTDRHRFENSFSLGTAQVKGWLYTEN